MSPTTNNNDVKTITTSLARLNLTAPKREKPKLTIVIYQPPASGFEIVEKREPGRGSSAGAN
jgi:hypothetical protein